ncbi:MAG: hypothetical protein KDI32_01185 [Pseudomonadales bacterium]|nr:hypothetical protein [Pseudomonadales bacterium]
MNELPPIVFLLLAFTAVGSTAWLLGRRSIPVRRVRLPRDYLSALDHLVNERFDLATEVIERLASTRAEQADIQFALGSLFRRRGEVARASAVHERLRESSVTAVREQATYELALDYLAAGLFDRAERYLEQSATSRAFRDRALDRLTWLYEQQRDFASALRIWYEMPLDMRDNRADTAAHYLCELAEQALREGAIERVKNLLDEARFHDPDSARAALLEARVARRTGTIAEARSAWRRAFLASPTLQSAFLEEALQGARDEERDAFLASLPHPAGGNQQADRTVNRFRCTACGLESDAWQWRCPSCRNWDTLALREPLNSLPWTPSRSRLSR